MCFCVHVHIEGPIKSQYLLLNIYFIGCPWDVTHGEYCLHWRSRSLVFSVVGYLTVCGCSADVMDEKQRPEKRPKCCTFMAHLCCCTQEATDMDGGVGENHPLLISGALFYLRWESSALCLETNPNCFEQRKKVINCSGLALSLVLKWRKCHSVAVRFRSILVSPKVLLAAVTYQLSVLSTQCLHICSVLFFRGLELKTKEKTKPRLLLTCRDLMFRLFLTELLNKQNGIIMGNDLNAF